MILPAGSSVEGLMTDRHYHWFEKLQVQVTTAAAVVATYFLIWPIVAPEDPGGPVLLIAGGSVVKAALLAGATWVLAALCCLTTVSARPQGTMVAVLIGLGGLSLHSGAMRVLLWAREGALGGMYWQMATELALLAAIAVAAGQIVRLVRRLVGGLAGGLAWRDPLRCLSQQEQRAYLKSLASDEDGDPQKGRPGLLGGSFARLIVEDLGMTSARAGGRLPGGDVLTRCGLCFLLCLAISAGMVWMLARSADRGQLLFALTAGNFLASLIAYQAFPSRLSWAAWAAPVATGVGFYVLAAVGAPQAGQSAWMAVDACYQALPIDWVTAGLGGSILGYWVSSRMHEAKFLDRCEEEQAAATGGRGDSPGSPGLGRDAR
jgi:hypothetical protein